MKKNFLKLCGLICAAALPGSCSGPADYETMLAGEGWSVISSAQTSLSGAEISLPGVDVTAWYNAVVPSTVMGTLADNGVYADAMEGLNYRKIDATVFDCPWWYRKEFAMTPLSEGEYAELVFDGISYRANVWLNGSLIASADELYGPFRRHTIDVTDCLAADNVLAVEVFRGRPGEPNIGFVDWNPRPADESMGIFREVRILKSGSVSISDIAVKSEVNCETLDEAWLTVEARLTNHSDKAVEGTLIAGYEGGKVNIPVSLAAGESKVITASAEDYESLHIQNPRLWWCRNLGTPELYGMDFRFKTEGRISDSKHTEFGIRKIEDYFTEDGHRAFLLNGKNVLVRSAGWTDDIFLRNTTESNEREVQYVCDMNLNSIRFENFWGTSQNIYELCDRYGLLVLAGWSCHWEWENYLGSPCDDFGGIVTEADMDLIAESLKDQVLWLRNHPSIIAWFYGSDMLPRPALEQRYLDVLAKIDGRPTLSAAKAMTSELTGPSGTKMAGPYEFVGPSYWYDTENAPGGAFGFNTETCIGASVPVIESIRKMIPEDRLWPLNEYWDYHCTASTTEMNSMNKLVKIITARYGEPKDLEDFLRKADWLNYEGTRSMFEAFRTNVPAATGIVQWMLNSAWPSMYWQLYDWYLEPTAAYYGVKDGNATQQLVYDYGTKTVVALNEGMNAAELSCRMTLYSLDGVMLSEATADITALPFTPVDIFNVPATEDNVFLMLELLDADGAVLADNYYCLAPQDDVYDWEASTWYDTPIIRNADFKVLQTMPMAELALNASRKGNEVTVTLDNTSNAFAFFVRLSFTDADGGLVSPVFYDDNYVSVPAGRQKTVKCTLPDSAAGKLTLNLRGWNVAPTASAL